MTVVAPFDIDGFKNLSSVQQFNAIRNELSPTFQERVPAATKASLEASMAKLLEYRPARNEFTDALVNQIALTETRNRSWTNPLAEFKRGYLPFGSTVQEVQVGLLKARGYEHDRSYGERTLFGRKEIDAQSSYHTINREEFYEFTISDLQLRRAFLSNEGMNSFIGQVMNAAATSDNLDEFTQTMNLFRLYHKNDGFFKVNVPDVGAMTSTEAQAKALLRAINTITGEVQFLSPHYNAARMPISSQPDELVILATPAVKAAIDINALAAAFNVSYAEAQSRIVVVPESEFGIPGVQCVLVDKDFFQIWDTFMSTEQQVNAAGLYTNHFYHHHQIISASRFVTAILFWTGEGDEIVTTPTPVTSIGDITYADFFTGTAVTEFERGGIYQLTGSAVTTPAGGWNNAIVIDVAGSESSFSQFNQRGVIKVGADEPSTQFKIRVYAEDDTSKEKVSNVAVTGKRVHIWPNREVIEDTGLDG